MKNSVQIRPTECTDFVPRGTPETNPNYETQISPLARKRVREADANINKGRCLVLNNSYSLEYAHCIRRKDMRALACVCVYPIVLSRSFTCHSSISWNGIGI